MSHSRRLLPAPASLDRSTFVARFGGIYEHSPWIAEAAFDAGLDVGVEDPSRLAANFARHVEAAGRGPQLALLRAHPELVGKLAIAGKLGTDSRVEQSSAGLDRCTPEQFDRFQQLNATYTTKFGFPFIIAVRGLDRSMILAEFERRVTNAPDDEFRTALDQVHRIARLRLEALATG